MPCRILITPVLLAGISVLRIKQWNIMNSEITLSAIQLDHDSYLILVAYLGSWILCEDCVVFPDLPLSGSYILQDTLLCCLHFERALTGYLHKALNTDKEILILQEACWHRDNSRYLLEKTHRWGRGKEKRITLQKFWQSDSAIGFMLLVTFILRIQTTHVLRTNLF